MSNSNRFLMGRMPLLILASGIILVLGGCGGGFGVVTYHKAEREQVETEYQACKAQRAIESEAAAKDWDASLEDPPSLPPRPTDAEREQWHETMQAWMQAGDRARAYQPKRVSCQTIAFYKIRALDIEEGKKVAPDWMRAVNDHDACLDRADVRFEENRARLSKWHKAHPEVTLEQLNNVLGLHGEAAQTQEIAKLKGMTGKERYQLLLWVSYNRDRPDVKGCEDSLQTQLEIQADVDREIQRLQPRFLYIVP